MTEWLHFHFSLSCIWEGNGNRLQCSCLENPRDCGAWWATSMGSHRVGHDWSDLAAVAEHFLTPYTKINSKWVKDLNIRPETIKLLEENIGKTLSNLHHSKILYDPPPRILETKAKINKWDIIKIKSFCTTKELLARWKDSLQNGRK